MKAEQFLATLAEQSEQLKRDGLYKQERQIVSAQAQEIMLGGGRQVINFCANNYLGLADHPALIEAAKQGLDEHGFGMASVRFICGTQDIHKQLERRLADFFGMEDSILYSSCFDANGGLFETLLGEEDAVISDALNHASIIVSRIRWSFANVSRAGLDGAATSLQEVVCARAMNRAT